ncbi:CBO0543 family protein [Neobacillus sp. D3-1R]|uniref:CBO0543 family protein n=1 Tax=Neobacillus sp. D3-1R TaxID=3445778 RepID=UPI003FA00451
MHILLNGIFLLAAAKWGDWRHWQKYYPTFLFFIGGDLFYNAVLHKHRLWIYQETIFAENLLFGHLVINLMIMAIAYASTILIFLGHYPQSKVKQVLWLLLWIFIYCLIEFINTKFLNLLTYKHGWNMPLSILFNFVMFPVLRIHMNRPLIAWGISILFFIFLYNYLGIPRDVFK